MAVKYGNQYVDEKYYFLFDSLFKKQLDTCL